MFNATADGMERGFVIVSGDDRALPVLGYSDTGSCRPGQMPPALDYWLDCLAQEMATLGDDDTLATAPQRALGARVAPLLTCNWNQSEPYNALMPVLASGSNAGKRAYTGCTATAMAQVMHYHRWPTAATGTLPAYTSKALSFERPALPPVTFDWGAMKDNYLAADSGSVAADAVATLMLYCTQALESDYKETSTSASASDIPWLLANYFGYARGGRYARRSSYTRDQWRQLLYNELSARRPVVYVGYTMAGGGHAFVCDGYDPASDLFHINWGWGGSSNGYFALSALTTNTQGIGSSSGTEGYIVDQAMAIGISPTVSGAEATAMTFGSLNVSKTSYTRASASSNFSGVTFDGRFSNLTGTTRSFYSGWALYHGSTRLQILTSETSTYTFTDLQDGWGRTSTFTLSLGSGLASGTYRIVPISRLRPNGSWEVCRGGDVNYVEATITGNTLTLTPCGNGGAAAYTVGEITTEGYLHTGKTVTVVAQVANTGRSLGDKVYLHVDGAKTTLAVSEVEPGESGELRFFFRPASAGTKTLTLSLNEDGSQPLATHRIGITDIPYANLSMTLNVPDGKTSATGAKTLPTTTMTVDVSVTNNTSETYDEGVMAYLCRLVEAGSGTIVRRVEQPLLLAGGAKGNMTFTFDGLSPGETYFVNFYYYSGNSTYRARGTGSYTVTASPEVVGDVDGSGLVDVDDMNLVINFMLRKATPTAEQMRRADLDGSGVIDVADMNRIINIVLRKA